MNIATTHELTHKIEVDAWSLLGIAVIVLLYLGVRRLLLPDYSDYS